MLKPTPGLLLSGSILILAVAFARETAPNGSGPMLSAAVQESGRGGEARPAAGPAPYRSSVVGTDFDFITEADPTAFVGLQFLGFREFEMPDKRDTGEPLVQPAYVFEARFRDSGPIRIALDKDFGSKEAATADAARYGPRLGKLPAVYRRNIKHVTVNWGGPDTTAFAEDKGHFFTIYSANASRRIATHDLEETLFHEATHASIQEVNLKTTAWRNAVSKDGSFITKYAKSSEQEDFAESALFAYTIIRHPERFPLQDRERIKNTIPNRIAYFRRFFESS